MEPAILVATWLAIGAKRILILFGNLPTGLMDVDSGSLWRSMTQNRLDRAFPHATANQFRRQAMAE
jgi:hypothetical protein